MKKLWEKYREITVYIIVGLLTTIVAYGVRFAVLYPVAAAMSLDLGDNSDYRVVVLRTVAISLGWVAGVIFAYFTNKKWVFRDTVSEKSEVAKQFSKFVASRLGTYFVEWGIGVLVPMLLIACGFKGTVITFEIFVNVDLPFKSTVRSESQKRIMIRNYQTAVTY